MGNIKSILKKYPLAYSYYNSLKKVIIRLKKAQLMCVSHSNKVKNLPNIDDAYRTIRELRSEPRIIEQSRQLKTTNDIDLTIIIPIYNSERFLDECLNSVAQQKSNYRIQVICVDDGSTDGSTQILDSYSDDMNFKIIHQKNTGHSGARNTALVQELGKYLMFIDSDDFVEDGYLKKMLDAAFRFDADIVQGGFCKCNANSVRLDIIECNEACISDYDELEKFGGAPWGRIYRTELWEDIFFPENMMFEDTIIFNMVFRRAKTIIGISNAYYMYRVYGNNTLDKLQGDARLLDAVWSVKYVAEKSRYLEMEISESYYRFFLGQCSKHVYYRIKHFDERVQKACFVILCSIVNDFNDGNRHLNCDDEVLIELEKAFFDKNFSTWKICSQILKNTNG